MPTDRLLFRRIAPRQWRADNLAIPLDEAFYLSPKDLLISPVGLSVFTSEIATPTSCLEHLLSIWIASNNKRWLSACGSSVQGMRQVGWGVRAVYESSFLSRGFVPHDVIEPNGHFLMIGADDAFRLHARGIILESFDPFVELL